MATTVLTGRTLTLTIATRDYTEQILSANVTIETDRLTLDTLAGKAYSFIDSNATLDIEFLNDAGVPNGITESLWAATKTAPNVTLAAVMGLASGRSLTFSVLPNFPSIGAGANDAQTTTTSLQIVGAITEDFTS